MKDQVREMKAYLKDANTKIDRQKEDERKNFDLNRKLKVEIERSNQENTDLKGKC